MGAHAVKTTPLEQFRNEGGTIRPEAICMEEMGMDAIAERLHADSKCESIIINGDGRNCRPRKTVLNAVKHPFRPITQLKMNITGCTGT
jgi:hypothetical protein